MNRTENTVLPIDLTTTTRQPQATVGPRVSTSSVTAATFSRIRPALRTLAAAATATLALAGPADMAAAQDQGFPDDCNGNGIPDDIEVVEGLTPDLNGNLIPDGCELGLQLTQLNWIRSDGEVIEAFSDWGRLHFQLEPSLAEHLLVPSPEGGLHGWLNVQLSVNGGPMQWQLRNHPIQGMSPEDFEGRLPLQFPLGLPLKEGLPAFGCDMMVSITPQPMPIAPDFGLPLQQQPVIEQDVVYGGGRADDGSTDGSSADKGPWRIPGREYVAMGGEVVAILCPPFEISIKEEDAPKVDEDESGCAPAGVARSLAYLKKTCPDLNLPDDAQDIYDDLKGKMGSSVGPGGDGTYLGPNAPDGSRGILGGKADYLEQQGLTGTIITTTSTNFADVADCLGDGADVEIWVDWGRDANGEHLGAHVAWVVRMQAVKDLEGNIIGWVTEIVDDPNQGDGVAENGKTSLVMEADGTLHGYGTGAKMTTFIVEKKVDPAVPGDANGDGVVDFEDIVDVLAAWGPCSSSDCVADLNGDGQVGFDDLIEVLTFFG